MVDNVLKYGTGSLIILYCYIYSGLSDILEVGVQNSMKLIRNVESSLWVEK